MIPLVHSLYTLDKLSSRTCGIYCEPISFSHSRIKEGPRSETGGKQSELIFGVVTLLEDRPKLLHASELELKHGSLFCLCAGLDNGLVRQPCHNVGSQLHFALLVIVSWRQLADPSSDSDPNRSWPNLFKIPNSHLSHPSTFQTSKLQTFCDKLSTTINHQTSGQQQSTTMDANKQNGGVEGTPCKKHTIEQSPRKPSPAKVSSLPSPLFLSLDASSCLPPSGTTTPPLSPLPFLHRLFLCFDASLPHLAKQPISILPPSRLSLAPQTPTA